MNIVLNGIKTETSSRTLTELLDDKEIPNVHVAIEVNGQIIPKSQLDNYTLQANDVIEIITFVGGG